MMSLLGVLAAPRLRRCLWSRPFRLGAGHRRFDLLGCRFVGFARGQQELKQHGSLELLHRIRDLEAGAARRVPLGNYPAGMRNPHSERSGPYSALPDHFTRLHNAQHPFNNGESLEGAPIASSRPAVRSLGCDLKRNDTPKLQEIPGNPLSQAPLHFVVRADSLWY